MVATETEVTATVSRRRGKKQVDLPTMEDHQRKIQEIEDLADIKDELDLQMADLKEKAKDADENLVASMKRHDRTFYERQSWGKVVLKESKTKAKVTKATVKASGDGEADPDETADE